MSTLSRMYLVEFVASLTNITGFFLSIILKDNILIDPNDANTIAINYVISFP